MGAAPRASLARWDAVIFDLGGVLLNLDYSATSAAFSRLAGRELTGLYSKTQQVALFDRFERGEIDGATFRAELRAALGGAAKETAGAATRAAGRARLSWEDEELDAAWNALLGDMPPRNVELLIRLRETHRVFLLSNTNEIHIAAFLERFERDHGARYGAFSELFHRDYYSHLMGLRKPDGAIFEAVVRAEALEASRTLFIDDNWHNVQGARDVGLEAAWLDVPAVPPARQAVPKTSLTPLDGARDVHELFARLGALDLV